MVFAGVQLSQTVTSQEAGASSTQKRTIYVQGNKQKIETPNIQTITDLDKHLLFVIDENLRAYQKIPLTSARASLPGPIDQVPTITLRKTDERRVIAHHPCHEYRGSQKTKIVKVSVSACVSDDTPGTEELQSFAQRAILEFGGDNSDQKNNLIPGVVLEEQSIITVRTQDPLGMKRTTSSIVRTRVTDIQERELPAATFLPSDDYNEVKPPQPAFPAEYCHPERGDLRVDRQVGFARGEGLSRRATFVGAGPRCKSHARESRYVCDAPFGGPLTKPLPADRQLNKLKRCR